MLTMADNDQALLISAAHPLRLCRPHWISVGGAVIREPYLFLFSRPPAADSWLAHDNRRYWGLPSKTNT
jgi:hypothetical protein